MKTVSMLVVLPLLLLLVRSAAAVQITVVNPSFENPSLADGAFTNNSIPGWQGTNSGNFANFGVYNPPDNIPLGGDFPGGVPEGKNVGYIERGAIFQRLSATLTAGTRYDLSVQVGSGNIDPMEGFEVQLRAGDSILAQLASPPVPANGTFIPVNLTFTALSGNPSLGQQLEIRLIETGTRGNSESNFDVVALEASPSAVPEPGTYLLMALGFTVLAAARVRRKGQ